MNYIWKPVTQPICKASLSNSGRGRHRYTNFPNLRVIIIIIIVIIIIYNVIISYNLGKYNVAYNETHKERACIKPHNITQHLV
jgi:hypothetical protein